jgi:uncharacterized protein (DUF302 family)
MSPQSFTTQKFQGIRVRAESSLLFDEVLARLRRLVPKAMPIEAFPSVMERAGGLNLETFKKIVESQIGDSGFMLFLELDHGSWLPLYGIQRKMVRWILGNPLIAITMMKHEPTAGLFAPVELLLMEPDSGQGSTIIYDLPSSLMVIRENPALREAASALDTKLEALIRRATAV